MSNEMDASDNRRPTAQDIASRLLAFSEVRLKVFEPYGMAVNDIAWQLLLRCFVAQERGIRLTIYRLCDEIQVPKSVSVRWLRALCGCDMVEYDETLGLSAPIRLTASAEKSLRDLIEV